MADSPRILYCRCAYSRAVPEDVKEEVLAGLVDSGRTFEAVPDLCELAAQGNSSLAHLAEGDGEVRIAACYPRAVKWLFHRNGSPLPEGKARICNMRAQSSAEVLADLLAEEIEASETPEAVRSEDLTAEAAASEAAAAEVVAAEAKGPGDWQPWFPVIDYDRCTNCMQCLSFCLFGVYDVDEQKQIEVREPQKCKTNCPACSRVCPEVAILFPKYKAGPINGDVVNDQDVEREKMKTDISSLLGGDIYALLRERHERAASRFSKERDEDRALKERQRCLKKLQADLDIPAELLAELPSAELIQERLAERLAKVDRAKKDQTEKDREEFPS